MKNDYKTSITIAKLVSFGGWLVVAVGIILLFVSLSGKLGGISQEVSAAIGLLVSIFGIFFVLVGQSCRAIFDISNTSTEMLGEMKKIIITK